MKVGIKSGSFTLLTPGHIWMFNQCKKLCDYLIVLCNEDRYILRKKGVVPIDINGRQAILRSLRPIDEVGTFKGFSEEFWIREFKETRLRKEFGNDVKLIVFHSMEFFGRSYVPAEFVADEIVFIHRIPGSTTEIFDTIRSTK